MDEDGAGTVFRDVIFLALAGFIAVVLIILPFINEVNDEEINTQSSMTVELIWGNEHDIDVDMWVDIPKQGPVGYSRKTGLYAALLRDDRGHVFDPTNTNYEIMFLRDVPDGEYTFNIHLYSNKTDPPVECTMIVKLIKPTKVVTLFSLKETLKVKNQELTLQRITFKNGDVVSKQDPVIFKSARPM